MTTKIAAACLVMLLTPGTAGAASLLDRMDGAWKGRGHYSETGGGGMERVTCRLDAKVSAQGDEARASGRCATVSGTARVSIVITRHRNGRYSARFSSPVSGEPHDHAGRDAGGRLVFDSVGAISAAGKRYRSRIVLAFSGKDRFAMDQQLSPVGGGATRPVLDMRFERGAP